MDSVESPLTVEAFSSTVMGVPLAVVAPKLKNILEIKNFALNRAISCCIVENGLHPTSVGCVRRCVLCPIDPPSSNGGVGEGTEGAKPSGRGAGGAHARPELILRERLVSVHHDAFRVEVVLDHVACPPPEANRCPFGLLAAQFLASSRTTLTAAAATHTPNRCFVAFHNTTTLRAVESAAVVDHWRSFGAARVDAAGMSLRDPLSLAPAEARGIAARRIQAVWQAFLDRVLAGLDQRVMDEAAALGGAGLTAPLQQRYEAFESTYCKWAATSATTLAKGPVVEAAADALEAWAQALRELKQQQMVVEGIRKDAEASQRISAEIARQMVEQHDALRGRRARPDDEDQAEEGETETETGKAEAVKGGGTADPKAGAAPPGSQKKVHFPNSHYIYSSDVILSDRPGERPVGITRGRAGNPPGWGTGCPPALLSRLFDRGGGALDEGVAREIFASLLHLTPRGKGRVGGDDDAFITAAELTALLLSAETAAGGAAARGEAAAEGATNSLPADSAFRKMLNTHDTFQQEAREKAMRGRAEDAIARYDFREKGCLYFDEFCLALMNLFKTQACV